MSRGKTFSITVPVVMSQFYETQAKKLGTSRSNVVRNILLNAFNNNNPTPVESELPNDPASAAIQYALETEDGLTFLRLWNEGEFDAIREEWVDCPKECFIGAEVGYKP